jgi:hypothetical protein
MFVIYALAVAGNHGHATAAHSPTAGRGAKNDRRSAGTLTLGFQPRRLAGIMRIGAGADGGTAAQRHSAQATAMPRTTYWTPSVKKFALSVR